MLDIPLQTPEKTGRIDINRRKQMIQRQFIEINDYYWIDKDEVLSIDLECNQEKTQYWFEFLLRENGLPNQESIDSPIFKSERFARSWLNQTLYIVEDGSW